MFYLFIGLAGASALVAVVLALYLIVGALRNVSTTYWRVFLLGIIAAGLGALAYFLFNTAQTFA